MADSVAALCGPAEAAGYRRFVDFVSELYRLEMRDFIDRNIDSPLSLLRPSLARLARSGLPPGWPQGRCRTSRTSGPGGCSRSRRCTPGSRRTTPSRSTPSSATWTPSAGVFFPRGGMHAVPRALAGAAEKHGVDIRYGENVTSVETRGDRAVAVVTSSGLRVPCDVGGAQPRPAGRAAAAGRAPAAASHVLSVVLPAAGRVHGDVPGNAHHTISFGHEWRRVFDESSAAG
jgi:phytoene desaturase